MYAERSEILRYLILLIGTALQIIIIAKQELANAKFNSKSDKIFTYIEIQPTLLIQYFDNKVSR